MPESTVAAMGTKIWEKWKIIARKIGDFQSRLLLNVFYFLILGPVALLFQWFSDPMHLHPSTPKGWMKHDGSRERSLEEARKQS